MDYQVHVYAEVSPTVFGGAYSLESEHRIAALGPNLVGLIASIMFVPPALGVVNMP